MVKKILLTILLLIVLRQFSFCCECTTEITNIDTLWKRCPVIFIGEYVGWDWYNLRNFKIIESIKGLPKGTDNLIMTDASCNLVQTPGNYYLIFAFGSKKGHQLYFSFTNCEGTREVSNEYKELVDYKKLLTLSKKFGIGVIDLSSDSDFDYKRKLINSRETFFHNQSDTDELNERNGISKIKTVVLYSVFAILVMTCISLLVRIRKLKNNK